MDPDPRPQKNCRFSTGRRREARRTQGADWTLRRVLALGGPGLTIFSGGDPNAQNKNRVRNEGEARGQGRDPVG